MARLGSIRVCVLVGCLGAGALAGGSAAEKGPVRVSRLEYHGWPGAYRLSNGTVDLVFVPQIGRIMRYGYAGEKNFLWENPALAGKSVAPEAELKEWVNFGGDKLWPAPQERWGWPPDPYLDRGEHAVEVLDGRRLRVTGPRSPRSGLSFSREISLARTGTEVTLRNTLVNTGSQAARWSVWEVAQVDSPDEACLPLHRSGRFPEGFFIFKNSPPVAETLRVTRDRVCLQRHLGRGGKIGGDSPEGWAAARAGQLRMTVSARYERGKEYPDGGCAQEIWSNPAPLPYMELELLSPLQDLTPGKRCTFTTRWRLDRHK